MSRALVVTMTILLAACSTPPATVRPRAYIDQPPPSPTHIEVPDARFTRENCGALHRTGALPRVSIPVESQIAALQAQRSAELSASQIARRCQSEIGGWEIHRTTDRMTDQTYCFARYTLRASYPGLSLHAQHLRVSSTDDVLRGYRLRFDEQPIGAWRMATSEQILNGSMRVQGAEFSRIARSHRLRIETQYIGGRGVYDLDLSDIGAVLTALRSSMCADEAAILDVTPFRTLPR